MSDESFPKAGTYDAKTGLVSNGKEWLTWAEYHVWRTDEFLEARRLQWLREQGIKPKEPEE